MWPDCYHQHQFETLGDWPVNKYTIPDEDCAPAVVITGISHMNIYKEGANSLERNDIP